MKIKIKLLKRIALLAVICISFSCKNSDMDMSKIDFSNIDNLYDQPLPIIQKCLEGKWQWTGNSVGILASINTNTSVDVTKKSVIIVYDDGSEYTFSYSWKKKDIYTGITTYVLWNNEQNEGWVYFDNIKNDTLCVMSYTAVGYLVWVKIK